MAAQHVPLRIGLRVVAQHERPVLDAVGKHLEAQVGGGVQVAVVVAGQRDHAQVMVLAPPPVHMSAPAGLRRRAVQHVAQHPQLVRAGVFDQRRQPGQVVVGAAAGQGDAGATEDVALAQVQVGDQQAPARGPVQRPVAQGAHRFTGQHQVQLNGHACVPAAARRAARAYSSPRC